MRIKITGVTMKLKVFLVNLLFLFIQKLFASEWYPFANMIFLFFVKIVILCFKQYLLVSDD